MSERRTLEVGSAEFAGAMREAYLRGLPVKDAALLWRETGGGRVGPARIRAGLVQAGLECRGQMTARLQERSAALVGVYDMAMLVYRKALENGDLKSAGAMVKQIAEMAADQKRGAFLDLSILNMPPGSVPCQPALADALHLPQIPVSTTLVETTIVPTGNMAVTGVSNKAAPEHAVENQELA